MGRMTCSMIQRVTKYHLLIVPFAALLSSQGLRAQMQTAPQLEKDETVSTIGVTVRRNFVVPSQVTVDEGWLRIVIHNPVGIVGLNAVLADETRNTQSNNVGLVQRSAKTGFFIRVSPGRHKIKIGDRREWEVDVTVNPRKKG
jgi:hypothetical protein